MKEAEHIVDASLVASDAARAGRSPRDSRSAAESGALQADQADQAIHANHSNGAGPVSRDVTDGAEAVEEPFGPPEVPQIADEDADRFALAFRPSWAPLSSDTSDTNEIGSHASTAESSRDASVQAPASLSQQAENVEQGVQEQLIQLRARRTRSRSAALAALSVVSFFGLVYWAVSSTTHDPQPTAPQSVARAGQPPQQQPLAATEPAAAEAPRGEMEQPSGASLTARLANPDLPDEPKLPVPTEDTAHAEGTVPTTADTLSSEDLAGDPNQASAELAASGDQLEPAPAEPSGEQTAATDTDQPAAPDVEPALAVAPTEGQPDSQHQDPPPTHEAPAVADVQGTPEGEATQAAQDSPPATTANTATAPTQPQPQPRAATSPSAATATHSAATAQPAPVQVAPRSPLLSVRAVPDGALLWLDGKRMSNPFDTRLPLGSRHKLEARYDGYETSSQTIRIETDARLTITLRRSSPPPAPQIKVQPLDDGPRGAGFVTSNPY